MLLAQSHLQGHKNTKAHENRLRSKDLNKASGKTSGLRGERVSKKAEAAN